MKILVLQDHTDFFERMLAAALDHHLGLPLSITVIDEIRRKSIVCRFRGQLRTLGEMAELLKLAAPGAETSAIERTMAAGVEGDFEGWYCVAEDEGLQWLLNHHAGPVIRWNGAVWWGRLKGITISAEVVTHESYTARRRKPRARTNAPQGSAGYVDPRGHGVRRADVQPIE